MTAPRAVGVRLPYAEVPGAVRDWVEATLGSPVASWADQVGGMSPGCATRLVTADGRRAFVKAVGIELNPASPTLFRREIEVLERIGPDPLWADLQATYDDGTWVALLLEDVPGGHPDLADDSEMESLLSATDRLVETLGRIPVPTGPTASTLGQPGLIDVQERFRAWSTALDHVAELPDDLAPADLRRSPDRLLRLVSLLDAPPDEPTQLTHWDIRVDNLLRPEPGRIVFVDWGAAAVAPAWTDPLLARFERVEEAWFDESVSRSPALSTAGDDVVTAFLVAFGVALAWQSLQPPADVGLPTLNDFRRTQARRALTAAARRLG
ncbi:MAG: aminoglycoside phosphotransferase family protein [Nocardioides sp.]